MKSFIVKSLLLLPFVVLILIKSIVPIDLFKKKGYEETYVAIKPIKLPIEVLGPDGYTRTANFSLKKPEKAAFLYLKVHKPSYRDASRNKSRGAKASVRINSGKWIDLINENVMVFPHEKAYGGLNGSYHTVRLKLPATFKLGNNKVDFRFNGTDGITNGFRILELNVMQGDTKLMKNSFFQYANPSTWKAPLTSKTDINKGKVLWFNKTLKEGPLANKKLKAKCASCHAKDGRDLKYFNYSNWSIIERSKFHGLTKQEGKQIASYIRSLKVPVPKVARPWNPPYQPGPGLDKKPAVEWSAGAGLDWVLEKDEEMLRYAFNGGDQNTIKNTINIDKILNVRETPIALQFPDWNEWLPVNHPIDLVGDAFHNVKRIQLDGSTYSYGEAYDQVRQLVADNPTNAIIKNKKLYTYMNTFANHSSHFHDVTYFLNDKKISQGVSANLLRPSFAKWSAVKQWEIMNTFNLEDKAPLIHPQAGEKRSWFTLRRNVFEIAPHRSASGSVNFPYQNILVGKYFSTAWYQLQLTINAGNKRGYTLGPVDWNYQPAHISNLYQEGGPKHPFRYFLSDAKMLQQFNDGRKIGSGMTGFRQLHPGQYWGMYSVFPATVSPTVKSSLVDQMLNATMDIIESYDIKDWPRKGSHPASDNTLRPATYKPIPFERKKMTLRLGEFKWEDAWITMIPRFREQGVSEPTLKRLIDWGETMWPLGNWRSLRNVENTQPLLMEAENYSGTSPQLDRQGNPWIISDKTKGFSGKGYVGTPNINGAAGNGLKNGAALYYNFKIKESGNYFVWVKRYASGGTSDSAHFGMDGKELKGIDHTGNYNQWRWVRIERVRLAKGNHTLQISRREDGYLIDQILISKRGTQINKVTTISLEAEGYSANLQNGDVSKQSFFKSEYVKGFKGSGYMATRNLKNPIRASKKSAALYYHFNTSATKTVNFWIRKFASDGKGNSATFTIDNHTFENMDNTSQYNSWKWIKIGNRTLLPGAHMFIINRREVGYRIDQIRITEGNQTPSGKIPVAETSTESGFDISVYPNPVSKGILTLDLLGDFKGRIQHIQLLDSGGKLIKNWSNQQKNYLKIDVSPYAPGLYFIKVLRDGQIYHKKCIIK